MGAIAVMLGAIGHWSWAPAWFAAYAALQSGVCALTRFGPVELGRRRQALHCVLATISFALAGAPTWHLWTRCGDLGVAAAVMFLCGMLVQLIVGSLGARRLFWFSAAPLMVYLLILPPLAWAGDRMGEGLAISACSFCLVAYLIALWSGYQTALERAEVARTDALSARADAERAAQAKGAFLATMSHEVRTPMNAVLGAASLLRTTRLDAGQAEYVDMIANAGSVLMTVLNDVLDLSKIEAGKFQINLTPTDLHKLVEACVRLWRPQAETAGLALHWRPDPDLPRGVAIDPERLNQILFNLLSNAVKFTAAGDVTLTVRAAPAAPELVDLTFTVADTGCGIAPDVLPRLFEAFEQADQSTSRQFGGTGLGLTISQRLAKLMGGHIAARSVVGHGSTFTLTLAAPLCPAPLAPPAPALTPLSPPLAHAASQTPASLHAAVDAGQGALRILVAEDNPVNRRIVQAFLEPLEAAVTFTENGVQALEALGRQAFDIVLMDIQMPLMDGIETTRRLRAAPGLNAGTPVIALTANVMEDQCAAYQAAGMNAFVAKPINPRQLLSVIAEFANPDGQTASALEHEASSA